MGVRTQTYAQQPKGVLQMKSIIVKLPRACGGQEILDAFRAAATFQETPTRKWEAHGCASASGVSSTENTFSPKRGYCATPAYLREQGHVSRFFRGQRPAKWETVDGGDLAMFDTQIMLRPLLPSNQYETVELAVHHVYGWADPMGAAVHVASSPDDEGFKNIRPEYDRIMKEFLRRIIVE